MAGYGSSQVKTRVEKEANILMEKALQECPNSGIPWASANEMVPRYLTRM
jgi:pre-mRNA-processing factor 6